LNVAVIVENSMSKSRAAEISFPSKFRKEAGQAARQERAIQRGIDAKDKKQEKKKSGAMQAGQRITVAVSALNPPCRGGIPLAGTRVFSARGRGLPNL